MNIKDFVKLKITYKPGWDIKITPIIDNSRWLLEVFYTTPDARSNETITLSAPRSFTAVEIRSTTKEHIIQAIFDHILGMEMHEAKEWFKIDGQHAFDPHAAPPGFRPEAF